MYDTVRTAVFPVAGLGTRFLPATKANPKEMLPIVDKPLIQYAVEEAIAAGIKKLIFVTSSSKRAIEDHFDKNWELEQKLLERNNLETLNSIKNMIPDDVVCIYIRQPEALGLGHAILCAKEVIGNEPFAISLADDLISGNEKNNNCLQQLIKKFNLYKKSILAVENVTPENFCNYGMVKIEKFENNLYSEDKFHKVLSIIEKPQIHESPSNLGVAGRYILTPNIFDYLQKINAGKNGEIQLTDAIAKLLENDELYCLKFEGIRFDCGKKADYLKAIIHYGLKHPETASDLMEYFNEIHPLIMPKKAKDKVL